MKLTSLLAASLFGVSFATAYAGDFYDDQMARYQALMNQANATIRNNQQQLMANPEIQQQYYQYQQSGGQNSFEQFVYFLGQTPQGQRERISGTNRAIDGVWDAQRGYNDAVTANGVSRSKSHDEFGNVIRDNAT